MRPRSYPVNGKHDCVGFALNIRLDRNFCHTPFHEFMVAMTRWEKEAYAKFKDLNLRNMSINIGSTKPVIQICFRYDEFMESMIEDCLDAVERGVYIDLPSDYHRSKIVGVDILPYPDTLG